MLKKLLPLLFLVLGTGAGIGAGLFLGPKDEPGAHAEAGGETHAVSSSKTKNGDDTHEDEEDAGSEFIKLNNQFVIPVVQHDRVASLVVLSLSLETGYGLRETVYEREPKIRDAFLQVLFDHANMGGFDGAFTRPEILDPLRATLLQVAQTELGDAVASVLIVDIARQDN